MEKILVLLMVALAVISVWSVTVGGAVFIG
jgi:hypothetical protein